MWLLSPKRTVRDVAQEILDGLHDGTVVLSATLETEAPEALEPDDTPHPSRAALRPNEAVSAPANSAS